MNALLEKIAAVLKAGVFRVPDEQMTALLQECARVLQRIEDGQFTKDEINNICHNLHGTVNAKEFAAGCAEEQRKLYGSAPTDDQLERMIRGVNRFKNRLKVTSMLRPDDIDRVLRWLDADIQQEAGAAEDIRTLGFEPKE